MIIFNHEVKVEPGKVIHPDGWAWGTILLPSEWEKAKYRIHSVNYPDRVMAINVNITGRTLVRKAGDLWVRIKIEWVGDGEESTFSGGFMRIDN